MARVLIADRMSPRAAALFGDRGIDCVTKVGLSQEELAGIISDFDGIAVRSATKVTPRILDAARKLRVVGRAGIGVDNIDLKGATARGVIVMNAPFGNSVTTAEHSIALLMALARQIPAADRSTRGGEWEKSRFMGVELAGKTLGLIGCGNIGSLVAARAQGLGMRVIAADPFLSPNRATQLGVERLELADLLERADFISLHTPLTDGTRNILNADTLARAKAGVRIVNCARGGLIEEDALQAALESGHVAGAALDVYRSEPPGAHPLFKLDNVVATPHLGASTGEAQDKVAVQIAEQMADFLLTGAVTNALNMPSVSAEEAPLLRPYIDLARQLGSFAGQITETGLKSVTLTYAGTASGLNNRPITAAALEGLLAPLLANVNAVNAPVVAKERNIEVTTVERPNADGYQSLVRLTVGTERGERTLAGTLFQENRPRVVDVEGISMEARLGPRMLYTRNRDKPGFIGALGSALGGQGINIATFHLGRDKSGAASALVEVDEPVPPEVIAEIGALPNVIRVKLLTFN